MASEYKCDICGKPATVHITKIIDNKKVKIHLCSECAEKASLDAVSIPAEILPKIQQLEQELIASHSVVNRDLCPTCGASLGEIVKGARFSCPDCYAALGERLFDIFKQMHNAVKHTGKSPRHHGANASLSPEALAGKLDAEVEKLIAADEETFAQELANAVVSDSKPGGHSKPDTKETLAQKLEAAISEERYEDAAKLRDKIKSLS